jgi:hypothetical protein
MAAEQERRMRIREGGGNEVRTLRLQLAGRPQPRLQLPFRLLNLVHARSRDDIISRIKYNLIVVPRYYPASTWVDWDRESFIILFSKQTSTLVSRSPSYSNSQVPSYRKHSEQA